MPRLRGEQHSLHKLSAEDVLAIRASYVPGAVRMADLAEEYDVSTSTISCILNGKTWDWLGEGEAGDGSLPVRSGQYGSLKDVHEQLAACHGSVLQLNGIGALTVATVYWGLGNFETITWDARLPDFDIGTSVARWPTLEYSEAYHYAFTTLAWASAFGGAARERAQWLDDEVREDFARIPDDWEIEEGYED